MRKWLDLPKDGRALAHLLDQHYDRSQEYVCIRRTTWMLAWYYLQGYRRFDAFNPYTGLLKPLYLDEKGDMEFQSQDLLYKINQVAGRIQSMDLGPRAERQSLTLTSLRSKAICQIFADSIVSPSMLETAKEQFSFLFTCLGSCGISGHLEDHSTIGLTSDLEVIHPGELFPFPTLGMDYTKVMGLMRVRMVPLAFLKDVYGKKIEHNRDSLEIYEVEWGEAWPEIAQDESDETYGRWSDNRGLGYGGSNYSRKDIYGEVVKVKELWLNGVNGTVSRYSVASGEYTIDDQDLSKQEVYCPVGFARFFNNGTFHGAGMFDILFSIHRQAEMLKKQLFNNIRDMDRYGVLVLPQGQFSKKNVLEDVGRGLRVMFWQPDPVYEGFKPFPIQPYNTGDLPGKVAAFAKQEMESLNPIQDLLQEKGRVDSASGLQFLDEKIGQALTSPTQGVRKAFGDCYRSLVQRAVEVSATSRRDIPVNHLTLDLAGAVISEKGDTISFDKNPVPNINRVLFTVKDVVPRSELARKMEALDLWQRGIEQDPIAFRLFAMEEGLDFAMYMGDDKGAYEAAIKDILTLYGNGVEPGFLAIMPHTVKADLTLRLVMSFMVGPHMRVASKEVIDSFKRLRETLMMFMGMVLPAQVPNPDDAAIIGMGMGPQAGASGPMLGPSAGPPPGRMSNARGNQPAAAQPA